MLAFLFLAFPFLSSPVQKQKSVAVGLWGVKGREKRGGRQKKKKGTRRAGTKGEKWGIVGKGISATTSRTNPKSEKGSRGETKSGAKTGAKSWDLALRCRRGHRAVPRVVDPRALAAATERPCRTHCPPPNSAAERSLIVRTLLGTPSNCLSAPQNALKLSARSPERPPIVCPHNQCCAVIWFLSNNHRFRFLKFPRIKEPPVQWGGPSFEGKFRIKEPADMGISETAKNRQLSGKNQPGYADRYLIFSKKNLNCF